MAQVHAIAVAENINVISVDGVGATITLGMDLSIWPLNGTPSVNANVTTTQAITATAATWKTAFITAIKNYAAAPIGTPDTYILDRLIGFVDFTTVANP